MKVDLAVVSHVLDASGQCTSVSLILGFKLDVSSCAIYLHILMMSNDITILLMSRHGWKFDRNEIYYSNFKLKYVNYCQFVTSKT